MDHDHYFKISLVLGGLNTLAAACDNNPVGVERVHQQHALPHLERILVSGPSLGTRSDLRALNLWS